MATDLTNINISDSYKGLIHANGASLPAPSIQQPLYDGSGQKSSISLGVAGVGASVSGPLSISGQLSAGAFTYPASPATNGYVLAQINSNTIALTSIADVLRSIPSVVPDNTYYNVKSMTIKNGLITAVLTGTEVRTFFCDLETFNATALSAKQGEKITSPRNIYPYGTSSATNVFNSANLKPILIRDNYLNKVWGTKSNNSSIMPTYGEPYTGDTAIVIFSDPYIIPPGDIRNGVSQNNYPIDVPHMYGIKYVWDGTNWIWERYLASGGPRPYSADETWSANYNVNAYKRSFQVNNNFSTGGTGPTYTVMAWYYDKVSLAVPIAPDYNFG